MIDKMLVKYLTLFLLVHFVIVSAQINLYFTDNFSVQHHCFYHVNKYSVYPKIIPFCMSEPESKWNIEKTAVNSIFTFAELNKKSITSIELYSWSAPIDVIERYQFYLNQLSTENRPLAMETDLFYNCTLPAFGPQCQYEFDIPNYRESTYDNIHMYYQEQMHDSEQPPITCYIHLKCDRGLTSICLDWTEICDGKMDCNDGIDEQGCLPLTTNVCQDNEYRCDNGQCIPSTLKGDELYCLDQSEISRFRDFVIESEDLPSSENEDVICSWRRNIQYRLPLVGDFTSSCQELRRKAIEQVIWSTLSTTTDLNDNCLLALQCHLKIPTMINPSICFNFCKNKNCLELIENTCSNLFYYPTLPIAFGHIYFAYTKEYIINSTTMNFILPEYICYNEQMCGEFPTNVTLLRFQGSTCRRREDFSLDWNDNAWQPLIDFIRLVYSKLGHCQQPINHYSSACNSSLMYQCENSSKCIPISYIGDGIQDCDYEDDEKQVIVDKVCLSNKNIKAFYKCANENKCIHRRQLRDRKCDCQKLDICDDENMFLDFQLKQSIVYAHICDGIISNGPIIIDGQIHTDETECERWPCVSRRTKCNYVWDCPKGVDELNCYTSPPLNCPSNHHICVSSQTNEFICLPIEKVDDNIVDCLGGIEESTVCPKNKFYGPDMHLYCKLGNSSWCLPRSTLCSRRPESICDDDNITKYCELRIEQRESMLFDNPDLKAKTNVQTRLSKVDSSEKYYCHNGLPLKVVLNSEKGLTTKTCFCPPSYYGDRCQYQNQRVSLIIKLNTPASSVQTSFLLIVSLIDNSIQRTIHSHQQLSFLFVSDIRALNQFKIQLVYSNQPKDLSKEYFVHIDIYETITLRYRGSMLAASKFPFLPVERIVVEMNLPKVNDKIQTCVNHQCIHGQCVHYLNDPKNYFCQCEQNWSGKYCNISYTCTCSSDSLCVGVTAENRSICVCRSNKFGSKCLISKTTYGPDPYSNGYGSLSSSEMAFAAHPVCTVPIGYYGNGCRLAKKKIFISFDGSIELVLPLQMFSYFIDLYNGEPHVIDLSSTIICRNNSSTIDYWGSDFDLLLIKLSLSQLYLIDQNKIHHYSPNCNVTVDLLDRCPTIYEVLDENISSMHLIRRIKYYHVPCQNQSLNLRCFHDDTFLCLCQDFNGQRVADCINYENSPEFRQTELSYDYDEMEYLCLTSDEIDLPISSTTTTSTTQIPILSSVTANQTHSTKSFIDNTTIPLSDSAFKQAFNIFLLLLCLSIH